MCAPCVWYESAVKYVHPYTKINIVEVYYDTADGCRIHTLDPGCEATDSPFMQSVMQDLFLCCFNLLLRV